MGLLLSLTGLIIYFQNEILKTHYQILELKILKNFGNFIKRKYLAS